MISGQPGAEAATKEYQIRGQSGGPFYYIRFILVLSLHETCRYMQVRDMVKTGCLWLTSFVALCSVLKLLNVLGI